MGQGQSIFSRAQLPSDLGSGASMPEPPDDGKVYARIRKHGQLTGEWVEAYPFFNTEQEAMVFSRENPTRLALNPAELMPPKCIISVSPDADPSNAASLMYTFTWSEGMTGFTASGISVTNGTKGTFTAVSAMVYTLVVTTATNQNNTQTVKVNAESATGVTSNLTNEEEILSIVIDRLAPTISIAAVASTINSGENAEWIVTYADTHLNAVTLTASDVTVNRTGITGGSISIINDTATTKIVRLSGHSGTGSVTINIAAGTANDTVGNLAPASATSPAITVGSSVPQFTTLVFEHSGIIDNWQQTKDPTLNQYFQLMKDKVNSLTWDIEVTNSISGKISYSDMGGVVLESNYSISFETVEWNSSYKYLAFGIVMEDWSPFDIFWQFATNLSGTMSDLKVTIRIPN